MTVDGHILLKMLEPALRPGSMGSSGNVGKAGQTGQAGQAGEVRPGTQPLEQQSFESLLAGQLEANSQQAAATDAATDMVSQTSEAADTQAADSGERHKTGHAAGPLGQLARIDQIENTSLRSLMSSTAEQKAGSDLSQVQPQSPSQAHAQALNQPGDVNESDFEIDRSLQEFLASE